MGLFVQDISVGLTKSSYLVEKVMLPAITKSNVNLTVQPGTVALIGSQKFKGQGFPYKLTSDIFGEKNCEPIILLYPDKDFDNITVNFFAGQHEVCLSALKGAKAKFSIVGNAVIEIGDFKDLADYFGKTITRDDLINEINSKYKIHLGNEVSSFASKYIGPETNENDLKASLDNVIRDVMSESRKTTSILFNMGLMISKRGISLHLNSLDDADEKIKEINDALSKNAIDNLNNPALEREMEERDKERQFEIDKIRAQNTKIIENAANTNTNSTKTYNTNTNGSPVTINDHVTTSTTDGSTKTTSKLFCTECGKEITYKNAKFCPYCGHQIGK